MKMRVGFFLIFSTIMIVLLLGMTGCSTPTERFGTDVDTSETSTASGDAYVTDAMSLRKWEPIRPKNDDVFYYKTCSQVDQKSFYSMTSYECSEP